MRKSITCIAIAVAALTPLVSQALTVNLFINNPSPTITRNVGFGATYDFTGTLTVTGASTGASANLDFAFLFGNNSDFLTANFHNDFLTGYSAIVNTNGGTYTGNLFTVTVDASDPDGVYDHTFNTLNAPQLSVTFNDSVGRTATGSGSYQATVESVPEPATMTILGGAITAMILRRRKNKA